MVDIADFDDETKRRSVLQAAALAGGAGLLPAGVSASDNFGRTERTSRDSSQIQLGDFEGGFDEWKTNGGNDLQRVTEDEISTGVTSGSRALAVEINGDAFPMIENKKRAKQADFLTHPHLRLHAIALAEGTGRDLHVQFRLHHTANGKSGGKKGNKGAGKGENGKKGNGKRGSKANGSSNGKDANVEESEVMSLPQVRPQSLHWDMSGLPDSVLETAKRLEIVWYVEGHEPDRGHRGKANGDFDYQGYTVFDDIRLTKAPVSDSQKLHQKRMNLHRDHGMIVERQFDELSETVERGTWEFVDGSSIPYSFEILGDDKFEKTIDGETFEIGEGWE